MLDPTAPLALFMEGALGDQTGKMGYGVLRYSPNPVACVIDSAHSGKNVQDLVETPRSCPVVGSVEQAVELGARVLVLGIAPPGGLVPEAWFRQIDAAVRAGLSIVNGLHNRLQPRYPDLAPGQWVWDIRVEPEGLQPGTGRAAQLRNRRILMIGTDMAIGKMTAGLELHRAARAEGVDAAFVATGQIGITIMGRGVPLDAVRVDFASGALEREVLAHQAAEWVVVEGQGALIHPGSTSTLPLLRGSCPTDLILCHRAGQTALRRLPEISIPPLRQYIGLYEDLAEACGRFPRPRTVAIALNTAGLAADQAQSAMRSIEDETGLVVCDPVREGGSPLVRAIREAN
jgi:uncharacterized NAD-dependent epimerase/dehydratase family protein